MVLSMFYFHDFLVFLTGAVLAWVLCRFRNQTRLTELSTILDHERRAHAEKLATVEDAQRRLSDTFQALAAQSLRANNDSFLLLARQEFAQLQQSSTSELNQRSEAIAGLLRPMRESIDKVDAKIVDLEKSRTAAFATLDTQLKSLVDAQNTLRTETTTLSRALRNPNTRGRWGELQLRRVVELAGMLNYCDFYEQRTVASTFVPDTKLRPDLTVKLPGGKCIVIDAKAPLESYILALEASDETVRIARLQEHAATVRRHLLALGRKSYWEQFENSPEFVVLFLPGENFFAAALECDPLLLETGITEKVILATPTTLIALLKAAAAGWRVEALAENAREIAKLGQDLAKRMDDMNTHWVKLGRSLGGAVNSFNDALGSYDHRVAPAAKRFLEIQQLPAPTEAATPQAIAMLPKPRE
ncbi:MAG: DNA recombination protein RmuC [Verrucomicrobia bacterium]|nr:MAG: DNA recombination protein RmuC [Verrucomicrobiota bacterium]